MLERGRLSWHRSGGEDAELRSAHSQRLWPFSTVHIRQCCKLRNSVQYRVTRRRHAHTPNKRQRASRPFSAHSQAPQTSKVCISSVLRSLEVYAISANNTKPRTHAQQEAKSVDVIFGTLRAQTAKLSRILRHKALRQITWQRHRPGSSGLCQKGLSVSAQTCGCYVSL
jgi:hypothetical protein